MRENTQPEKFLTAQRIAAHLRELGVQEGDILLAHTSLSSLGWVCGGAEALARGLLAAVGSTGTLVFPTQTGENSDPAYWQRPAVPEDWQQEIRDTMPAFDLRTTPSRHMGATAELLRTWPGALRSDHPTSSFGAIGPAAAELLKSHSLEHALGDQSPLGALYRAGAKVLLLGVGYENCTAFHLAEDRAGAAPLSQNGSAVYENGRRIWREYQDPDYQNEDFEMLGAAMEEAVPVQTGFLADARAKYFPLAPAVDFGVQWLQEHRGKDELRLVRLDLSMEAEYRAFLQEFEAAGEGLTPAAAAIPSGMSFSQFYSYRRRMEQWVACPEGIVPSTLFLLVDREDHILGAIDVRHDLTEYLENYGGHIGYGVRPSQRKKGLGTAMLRMALPLARTLGLRRVLITCKDWNIPSARVMEKNGGIMEDIRSDGTDSFRRYWFTL